MAAEDLPPADDAAAAAAKADEEDDEDELFGNDDEEATPVKPPSGADGGGDDAPMAVDDGTPSTKQILKSNPPPEPLPAGWFLKPSHSSPGNYYYFNQDTGECRWEYPSGSAVGTAASASAGGQESSTASPGVSQESLNATAAAAAAAVKSILKRSNSGTKTSDSGSKDGDGTHQSPSPRKKIKPSLKPSSREKEKHHHRRDGKEKHHHHASSSNHHRDEPKEVRVLHILKKHRGSRRPASWRNPKITDTKEKAISDLRELISILNSSGGNAKELRATFEELAKAESDCSSAKRGGDLGFFGRKKMQPAFERASFGLKVGQLSDIVDTSSGVHVILRLA